MSQFEKVSDFKMTGDQPQAVSFEDSLLSKILLAATSSFQGCLVAASNTLFTWHLNYPPLHYAV